MELNDHDIACIKKIKMLTANYLKGIQEFKISEDRQPKVEQHITEIAVLLGLGPNGWEQINDAIVAKEAYDESQKKEA